MNYDELIADLRYCADTETSCSECKRIGTVTCEVNLHSEAADAIEELQRLNAEITRRELRLRMQKPRWIPVTERLPEKNDDALFYTEWTGQSGTIYREMQLTSLAELTYQGYRPIAWQPLPTPLKEDEA